MLKEQLPRSPVCKLDAEVFLKDDRPTPPAATPKMAWEKADSQEREAALLK
jgi:hypothetical protein